MTNPKETGHEKNVANLELITESVNGFGKDYNPAWQVLAVSSLKNSSAKCREANNIVMAAVSAYKSAVDEREAAFEKFRNLLIRVGNSMLVSDLTPENINTAKEMIRKMHGRRAPAKKNNLLKTDVNKGKQISISQLGYDNQLKNAAQLINFLFSRGFMPNEKDLQVESLSSFIADLQKKNAAVVSAKSALADARILRNELMYKEGTGLVSLGKGVKAYVKSLFGPSSPQYKKISGISFSKM